MQNTKLIQLLKSFSPNEFKQFKDFVCSPIFNKNKKVAALYEVLKKYYPEFNNKNLSQEKVFKKVFPKEKYNYFKIKNISSDLFILGKEFISFCYHRKNSESFDIPLLGQLRDRNLDNAYHQTFKVFESLTEKSKRDEFFYFKQFELESEKLNYIIPIDPNLRFEYHQTILNNFLNYALIILMKRYNLMLHENAEYNYTYDFKMMEDVLKFIESGKVDDNPTVMIYYNIIMLETKKEEKYFFELKKLKDKYIKHLNIEDVYNLFLHMSSFCANVFNLLARTDFAREHFLLSKENFENGTIVLGKILYPDFLNHVKIAVHVNEFDWAEMYMKKYKDELTEEKESTLNFCYGYINYKKGNLDKAMDLLSQTNFPNFIIKIQVKILLLQIYFEKGFYEQAISMIDTFRHYVSREKSLLEEYKESFYDYLNITGELIRFKMEPNRKETEFKVEKIKQEIENIKYNHFGIKLWLRAMINE